MTTKMTTLKTVAVLSAAIALTACTKSLLWKSPIEGAEPGGLPLPIAVSQTNEIYQLFLVGTALHLRKMDDQGEQIWSVPVNPAVSDANGATALRLTSQGPVVGYGTGTSEAWVSAFDAEGNLLWVSDLGTHTGESIADMVVHNSDQVTVAIKVSASRVSTLQLDANGNILWNKTMPNCSLGLYCATTLALDSSGNLLQSIAELSSTKSYLIDAVGNTVWTRSRSTGISLAGVVENPITPTSNGFMVTHAFSSWEYDLAGNLRWTNSTGGTVSTRDANGYLYVGGTNKISKLDGDGNLVTEFDLDGQLKIDQLEWVESKQRLVALSQYSSQSSVIIGKVSLNVGQSLWYFDAEGKRIAKYNGAATVSSGDACEPFPSCTTVETTHGDNWGSFAVTPNNKVVISGIIQGIERYATAYNLK